MAKTRRMVRLGVLTLIGWLAMAGAGRAQVTTADIIGRVTDASGGTLPGATVTITNPATGETRTVVSSETGDYTLTLETRNARSLGAGWGQVGGAASPCLPPSCPAFVRVADVLGCRMTRQENCDAARD
jgi:hypothetical protein